MNNLSLYNALEKLDYNVEISSSINKSTIIFPEPKITFFGDLIFLCFKILLKFEVEKN